jgi:hypothetical protein
MAPAHGRPRRSKFRLGATALIAAALSAGAPQAPAADAAPTVMRILVVYGPGHSAIGLERDGHYYYWDPGGSYGEELTRCRNAGQVSAAMGACNHLLAFDWEALETGRRNDVFTGPIARFMHVLSVYHSNGSHASKVYTVTLDEATGERAWEMVRRGRELAGEAAFATDRQPFFCVKAVTEFLRALGGRFADIDSPWRPGRLEAELARLGLAPSHSFTRSSPEITGFVNGLRRSARGAVSASGGR